MAAGSTTDRYANVLYDQVTESAANTLTFEEINVGLNIFDKVGLVIHRIAWYRFDDNLVDGDDTIQFGLSASNGFSSVNPDETSIITFQRVQVKEIGTAASALQRMSPYISDFSNLPGGGILTTPKPLYLFAEGSNLASASTIRMRMFFTVVKLKPEEYFELLEARQYFG